MNTTPVTAKGVKKIREQLHKLKTIERQKVIQAIAEARAHGDLSENAEYHAAREQQSFIEGRINTLESTLAEAQLIDVSTVNANGKVVFGATVELLNLENKTEIRYQIVGEDEADVDQGQISILSPIARALIGKEEGDIAEVSAPGSIVEYEILGIQYV